MTKKKITYEYYLRLDNENDARWDKFEEHNSDCETDDEHVIEIKDMMKNIEASLARIREELSYVNCKHRCSVSIDTDGSMDDDSFGMIRCDNCDQIVMDKHKTCSHDYPLKECTWQNKVNPEVKGSTCSNCGMMQGLYSDKKRWSFLNK
jgi:hypothetical protein|tara:strand:- start:116 stop:562 length:447 start_codon:yes stop_codon:yes gene_type:complete